MPRTISVKDIRKINEVYHQCKSLIQTSEETGWSIDVVKSYIDKNFDIEKEDKIKRFDPDTDMPSSSTKIFEGVENFGELCILSDEEKIEIVELWEEIKE